ncbi:hypothetical protein [Patulibacter sp. SYSU D01012]|uniref:hypothetical protein n=1 Tax=Patulibacter sp. SYSU D01012 TaxID=2817381 RepID=UPI001B302833|nr:hypothetical protein [Patulibacter sp. SYSU D01012]
MDIAAITATPNDGELEALVWGDQDAYVQPDQVFTRETGKQQTRTLTRAEKAAIGTCLARGWLSVYDWTLTHAGRLALDRRLLPVPARGIGSVPAA